MFSPFLLIFSLLCPLIVKTKYLNIKYVAEEGNNLENSEM